MEYEKIYQCYYSRYYYKAEFFAKRFFIKRQSQNKTYLTVLNETTFFLNDNYICISNIHTNENLRKLHHIFSNRYSIYTVNQIQEIFENEVKIGYNKLKISELPKNYNYKLFIKEIALFEALNEISRLLSNYSRLFEMMYKLNDFDDFEIRTQGNLSVEDFPVYKRLKLKLYPEENEINIGLHLALNSIENFEDKTNFYPLLFINSKVYDCFMQYQKHIIDFYSDYSYLKKRLEKEKLIHNQKDNDFIKIIYEDMKLISEKNYNEYYINNKLKSLEKSYSVQRENNFNIVFEELL